VGRESAGERRRGDPNQHTLNGAYASREEALKGSITPGKLADFVVLAEDPHAVDPSKIRDIRIVRTVVGGDTKHEV
jgi:predicted amidohydrolase YtcJ